MVEAEHLYSEGGVEIWGGTPPNLLRLLCSYCLVAAFCAFLSPMLIITAVDDVSMLFNSEKKKSRA